MHEGEMNMSVPPATKGVSGVTSVNTRTGVVTLVPSDVGITAAVDKGLVYMDGATYANSAVLTWDKTTKTLTVGATGIINAPSINASVLMTTPEIDIGASAFPFLESSPGVCQLADPNLTWTSSATSLSLLTNALTGGGGTGQLCFGSGGLIAWNDGSDAIGVNISQNSQNSVTFGIGANNDNTTDLGGPAARIRTGYFGTSVVNSGYDEFGSIATPSAPTAAARLYSKVVGGKVALMVLFPSGAEQQIKIEP